jgi:hypothetical protein
VDLFVRLRPALKPTATVWVNLGDTYGFSGKGQGKEKSPGFEQSKQSTNKGTIGVEAPDWKRIRDGWLRPKQLLLLPSRFAIAMQDAGFLLRNDIVWTKPNAMPSSVKDRFSCKWEHVFLFTVAERYWFDLEAVRVPHTALGRPPGNNSREYMDRDPKHHTGEKRRPELSKSFAEGGANPGDVWSICPAPFPEAHFACVDDQTECLTTDGWKGYANLKAGDVAAQYDAASGRLSWGEVNAVSRYVVKDQPMVRVASRDLDMLLTPNHRCLISSSSGTRVVRADALRPKHRAVVSGEWDDAGAGPSEAEAELVGWYVAEGSRDEPGRREVRIAQSATANPQHVQRIGALCRTLGIDPRPSSRKRMYRGRAYEMKVFHITGHGRDILRRLAPNRVMPWSVLCWSGEALTSLLRGLIGGDGHTRPEDGRQSFIQKDERTASLVQAIGVRLGYAARLSHRPDGQWVVYLTRKNSIGLRGTNGMESRISTQAYTGVVWCPSLPLGTWVARRNGRVFVTGNTFPPELVRRCLLAGCPREVCVECGKPKGREIKRVPSRAKMCPKTQSAHEARGGTGVPIGTLGKAGSSRIDGWTETLGWRPTCDCQAPFVAGAALDPFVGSGTTLCVAKELGLSGIGFELNPAYCSMSEKRIAEWQRPKDDVAAEEAGQMALFDA